MSDAHLHRGTSTTARLRRHRWSSLLVIAAVVLGFGGSRLFRDDPSKSAAVGVEQQPGMRSTVSVDSNGSLQIIQRLTFATPRSTLTVAVPIRSAPDNLFDPRIDDLRLSVNAQATQGPTGTLSKGETFTFKFPVRATTAELEYSVKGVSTHTRPSVPGRVLTLATPLAIEDAASLPTRIEVNGKGVLNVGCTVSGGPLTTCGTETARGWVVERRADDEVDVLAQVNLPVASPR